MFSNINLTYSVLLIKASTKRSFEELGRMIGKSGDTIKRMLPSSTNSSDMIYKLAKYLFANDKELILIVDDTLLKKIHSTSMAGTGWFFDTKIGRSILAFKLIAGVLSNGKFHIPFAY